MSVLPLPPEPDPVPAPTHLLDNPAKRSSGIWRRSLDVAFRGVCIFVAFGSVAILITLLITISLQAYLGITHDSRTVAEAMRNEAPRQRAGEKQPESNVVQNAKSFLTNAPNPGNPWRSGIFPSIMGTMWLVIVCGLFTVPVGIGTAILLEEFKPKSAVGRWLLGFVQLNISNLAGVPSIVYGLLGLTAFVQMFGLFGTTMEPKVEIGVKYYDRFIAVNDMNMILVPVASKGAPPTAATPDMAAENAAGKPLKVQILPRDAEKPTDRKVARVTIREGAVPQRYAKPQWYYLKLPFGYSVLSGGLTLMLVVLPIIIIASQEALRAVPDSLREGCLGLGATPWQTVWNVTLPAAIPGIMTGAILSMSRAIGEAAPLLIVVAAVVRNSPKTLMDECFALPLQIHEWAMSAYGEFQNLAACAIVVLLALLLSFNAVAILIRQRFSRPLS